MKHATPSERRLGFRIHAAAFVLGLVILAALNLTLGPPYWILWVVLGWTIGIVSHWWFGIGPGSSPG